MSTNKDMLRQHNLDTVKEQEIDNKVFSILVKLYHTYFTPQCNKYVLL